MEPHPIFQVCLDHIAVHLPLKNIATLKSVCACFNEFLSRDGFWKWKSQLDYQVVKKKETQTWLDRYKLARRMGHIYIHDLGNNPPVDFDIGKKLEASELHECISTSHPAWGHQLLPYRAIDAIHIRPCVYFINDELELYMVGEPNYCGTIYKEPKLVDTEVTLLGGNSRHLFYILNGDIHSFYMNKKRQLTFRGDVISFSCSDHILSYITRNHLLYKATLDEDDNTWIHQTDYISNVVSVSQYGDMCLYLDTQNRVHVSPNKPDLSLKLSQHKFIALYDGILVTDQNVVLSLELDADEIINEDEDEDLVRYGDKLDLLFTVDQPLVNGTSNGLKCVLTKKGTLYFLGNFGNRYELKLKVKHICPSPENLVLILD